MSEMRCRNWSLPVVTTLIQSDWVQRQVLPRTHSVVLLGGAVNRVVGSLNCSVSAASRPMDSTWAMPAAVGPKLLWSRKRAAAVALAGGSASVTLYEVDCVGPGEGLATATVTCIAAPVVLV